jgi:hypothetical protein
MVVAFIAIVVAAIFNVFSNEWAAAASSAVPLLIALYSARQSAAASKKPDELARELAEPLAVDVSDSSKEAILNRGLDTNSRMEVRWRLGAGSNPNAQRAVGLPDSGTLDQLTDTIGRQVGSGGQPRLVVTGMMGAGKTSACVLLAAELAERHGCLAVFMQLATWDPDTSLQTWLADQLIGSFPDIEKAPNARKVAAALASRHILPILDGLDEVREIPAALRTIDREMRGRPFVLTCRSAEFALANAGGVLHQAVVVDLQPLRADEVRGIFIDYEPESVGGPLSTLVTVLETDPAGSVAQVLNTPLMVSLARDADASLPDLGAMEPGQDVSDVFRRHLLGTFVTKAYADHPDVSQDQAKRYLKFLAEHADSAGRIAWWMLYKAVPRVAFLVGSVIDAGVVCGGLGAAFFALFDNPWLGLWIGLGAGVIGAVIDFVVPQEPPRRARPRFRSLRAPMPKDLARIIGFGVMGGAALAVMVWVLYGPVRYIIIGGLISAVTYAAASYIGQPNDPLKVVTPDNLLRVDRTTVMYAWLVGALAGVLTGGYLGMSFKAGHRSMFDSLTLLSHSSLTLTLIGAASGCVLSGAGLGLMAMGSSAWGKFLFTRLFLAVRGSTPLRLMTFLDGAYRKGILRQVNGYYEFRHQILLNYYLDEPELEVPTAAPGAIASPA